MMEPLLLTGLQTELDRTVRWTMGESARVPGAAEALAAWKREPGPRIPRVHIDTKWQALGTGLHGIGASDFAACWVWGMSESHSGGKDADAAKDARCAREGRAETFCGTFPSNAGTIRCGLRRAGGGGGGWERRNVIQPV